VSGGAPPLVGFGWVVDDDGAAKRAAGGPAEFARRLVTGALAPCAPGACPTCDLLDEPAACVGVIEAPISPAAEQWLAGRLPASIESLPGQLLRQNLKDGHIDGRGAEALRRRGMMAAPKPFTRHWGPFFRGYAVTTDQLFEQMLCAGDVQPSHALAVLVHLGGIAVDDEVPLAAGHGPLLAAVVQAPAERPARALCTIQHEPDDDRSTTQLKRALRALYAAFALDTELRLFEA
jgi:hypothetical protein